MFFSILAMLGTMALLSTLALLRTLVCYVLGSIINFPDSPSTTDNCHTNAFSGPARPLTSNRVTVLCHIRMVCTVHSAQCTPQTLNKLHKSYTLHIGMVCTTPISQVYPTICTKCAHCTEGLPYVTSRECAKFAHITHSTNCTYPTHSSLC